MNEVIVIVLVDEPKDDICPAETICTGVFCGFKDEEDAEKWIELVRSEWENRVNVRWIIDRTTHKSKMF